MINCVYCKKHTGTDDDAELTEDIMIIISDLASVGEEICMKSEACRTGCSGSAFPVFTSQHFNRL